MTSLVRTSPRVSGLYGAEMASVSTWKQSVSAWPNPYVRNEAAAMARPRRRSMSRASESATTPVIPETKRR